MCMDVFVHKYVCVYIQVCVKTGCVCYLPVIWFIYVCTGEPNGISLFKMPPPCSRINNTQGNWGPETWGVIIQRCDERLDEELLRGHATQSLNWDKVIPAPFLFLRMEALTKLVWNSNSNTHWKVFWKCLYKQKGTFPLICPSAWENNFLSEPTCLKWSQFPAQPAPAKQDGIWTLF